MPTATMPLSTMSALSSASSTSSRSSDGLPFPRNLSDFEVEHSPKLGSPKARRRRPSSDYDNEAAFRTSVDMLIAAKARPFCVSGRIPVDPSALVLFFRSKSGITHSLDFPIDIDYDMPPSFDVLVSACRPHSPSGLEAFSEHESLFYPPHLPLTTTLEIANHPILEAVRNTLFPTLPTGHYLTIMRDKLQVWLKGSGMRAQSRPGDMRVATIMVTLPVRFRGGDLIVRAADGSEERFHGRGGKAGDMEWTAFMSDCDHEIEPVTKGCRVTISYAVHLRTFGTAAIQQDALPLISPSDQFLDTLSPVLNMARGRRIAFHLTSEYGINPAEALAESLVPHLKGGDSILYHALKLYKLEPELHWSAGSYIWPVDQTVDFSVEIVDSPIVTSPRTSMIGSRNITSPLRAVCSVSEAGDSTEDLRTKVERSGAVPLAGAGITICSTSSSPGGVGKERVPFVQGGDLEKLVVNVLLVVYVP